MADTREQDAVIAAATMAHRMGEKFAIRRTSMNWRDYADFHHDVLSDEQRAAIATYALQTWRDAGGGKVSADPVSAPGTPTDANHEALLAAAGLVDDPIAVAFEEAMRLLVDRAAGDERTACMAIVLAARKRAESAEDGDPVGWLTEVEELIEQRGMPE